MNPGNECPRILLVENDRRVRESYEFLLKFWEYYPILATGQGESLIKDAITKAKKYHCILALIDLRLVDDFDEEDTSGLELTREIGPIRSIILSGFPSQRILREILDKYQDITFLSKADSPERIKQTLDIEVSKVCACKRGLKIEPANLLDEITRTTFGGVIGEYQDQVTDILAQLMPGAIKLKIDKLDSSLFRAQASTVPRPKSVVLRVFEEDYEPVVVKLARTRKIEEEVERYEKFISRKVSGYFAARLERHATLWDIGGARYSYIGEFDVKTFSRFYEEHPAEDIRDCLNSFFQVSWGKHYERAQELLNVSLFDMYNETWGNWYDKSVKNFSTQDLWISEGDLEQLQLPNPIDWFKTRIAENRNTDFSIVDSTRKAITHGDLHGDNLLVDSQKNAWVIDFERAGYGHALQDFIELEADILNRLEGHSIDVRHSYQICTIVACPDQIGPLKESDLESSDPGIRKILQTISLIRSLAYKCTGIRDARQYLLGLLFNTIFRATINKNEKYRDRQRRALMLAGIFCHRLDHWNEPWPPQEWSHILQGKEE